MQKLPSSPAPWFENYGKLQVPFALHFPVNSLFVCGSKESALCMRWTSKIDSVALTSYTRAE
jgi:hypothetical protein